MRHWATLPRRLLHLLDHPLRLLLQKGPVLGGCGVLVLHGAGEIFVCLGHSYFLVRVSDAGVTRRVVTPPATSSTSAATVDLKSTDSGAAARHLEDPAVAGSQSCPLATPAAPSADAVLGVPSSEVPGDVAPKVKPAELGPPYFGRLDLASEDKARAIGRVSAMVS